MISPTLIERIEVYQATLGKHRTDYIPIHPKEFIALSPNEYQKLENLFGMKIRPIGYGFRAN